LETKVIKTDNQRSIEDLQRSLEAMQFSGPMSIDLWYQHRDGRYGSV